MQLQSPRASHTSTHRPARATSGSNGVKAGGGLKDQRSAISYPPSADSRQPTADSRSGGADELRQQLSRRIGSQKFEMWFAHTAMRLNSGQLEIHTDSQFVADWIGSNFSAELHGTAVEALGSAATVDVRVTPALVQHGRDAVAPDANGHGEAARFEDDSMAAKPWPRADHRKPKSELRRLADFVVGDSNKLAFAAARRLAEESDTRCVSPLFIYGDCGLGKTHLLQAVCQRYIELTGRSQQVRYVTGEQFTNEYIAAIRNNTIDAFRQKIRKLDLLAIDDVHFLTNKTKTQTELLYTLDAIDLSGSRVVLASDNHPHNIKRFNPPLISRFLSGMVVKVDKPDRATRIELIRHLVSVRGMRINNAAAELIASICVGSVRELEGAVTKLAAYKSLLNGHGSIDDSGEIGVVLAEQLFHDDARQPMRSVRMDAVIEVTCNRLGVTRADVLGSGRHRRVVLARGLVAYLGRELTTHSFPEIAQSLGRNNHSTIHTADQRLRKQMLKDEPLRLGGGEPDISLKELTDQLRRSVVDHSKSSNGAR